MPVDGQRYAPAVKLTSLIDHPQNPRRGSDDAVAKSLDSNGWYGAIVAQQSTKYILAGHTRRRTLASKGELTAPVIWLDVDDETALRILLADNRSAELAEWDEAALTVMLQALGPVEMESVGFSAEDLATLVRRIEVANGTVSASDEWDAAGMPGYDSDDHLAAYRTVIHFASEDDANLFFAKIDRPKLKTFWWPQYDGHEDRMSGSQIRTEQT